MAMLIEWLFGKAYWLLAKIGLLPDGNSFPWEPDPYDSNDAHNLPREPVIGQPELAQCQNESRNFRRQLEDMQEHYAVLNDLVPVGCLILDENGRTVEINQAGAAILGRERAHLIGKHFMAWLTENDRYLLLNYLHQIFLSRDNLAIELKIKTPDNTVRDVHLESRVVESAEHILACHVVMTDLSERRKADETSRLISNVIENVEEGIMVTDADMIIRSVNPAFEKTTGYTAAEAIGKTPALLKSGHHGADFYREMWDALNNKGKWQGEIWNRQKSGDIYPEWLNISSVKDNQQKVINYVGIFSDANTHAFVLERLQYLAYFDGLTGLPNRRLFLDRLGVALSHARRDKHVMAVIFIDLDEFKPINDNLGHQIGDKVLVAVAERMKGCLRENDTLARLGGDEFTAILPQISQHDDASNVARKFLECMNNPLSIDGHELHITASVGTSIFPDDGEDADTLLHHADSAMYRIKKTGRNGYSHRDENIHHVP
ncbi:MAG: hypothetical protein A3H99_02345 [Gallionellales bacterium RIFCSPLOWO2_02_FULL_59_110]|nr:MAG: hypothetical protein A3H99_02345 [Gallionellales bacterium RIFCSPLOWO2_02_FULL_59_110]